MKRLSSKKRIKKLSRDRQLLKKRSSRKRNVSERQLYEDPDLKRAISKYHSQIAKVGHLLPERRKVPRHGKRAVFDIVGELDFEDNYAEMLKVILALRKIPRTRRKLRYYLEFEKLTTISPGALLALAAEIDCLFSVTTKATPADTDRWDERVTALFNDFGIFELLNVNPVVNYTFGETLKASKFIRGTTQDGGAALQLIENIVKISNEKPSEGERLYEGLGEALANALDHGHPNSYISYPANLIRAWWAGAIYDESTKTTYFMVYDRGIGLPASIPEKHQAWFSTIYDTIKGTKTEDAELIWAAIKSPRSGTQLKHRGEGLKQMAEVVDNHPGSQLQILSGKGSVTYSGKGKRNLNALPVEFPGTLVEWRIHHD